MHEIDVENLKLRGHHCEVDELQQWPHFKICLKCGPEFLTKLIFGSLEGLALALGGENVETGNRNQAEKGLSKQQFFSHRFHGISRGEERDEVCVGIVKSWAVGEKAIRHEVQSTTVVVLRLGWINSCTTNTLAKQKFKRNVDVIITGDINSILTLLNGLADGVAQGYKHCAGSTLGYQGPLL